MAKMMETVLYYNPGRQTEPGHKELMGREPEPDLVSFRLYRRRSWY